MIKPQVEHRTYGSYFQDKENDAYDGEYAAPIASFRTTVNPMSSVDILKSVGQVNPAIPMCFIGMVCDGATSHSVMYHGIQH